jgi:hypothetical protein
VISFCYHYYNIGFILIAFSYLEFVSIYHQTYVNNKNLKKGRKEKGETGKSTKKNCRHHLSSATAFHPFINNELAGSSA